MPSAFLQTRCRANRASMALPQVFERIEDVALDQQHVLIIWEHQRQLLLEHQHAGRNRRADIPAVADRRGEHRDIGLFILFHMLQIAEFELGHAAAHLALDQFHGDAVVTQHGGQILHRLRRRIIAVAGREQRNLAARASRRLGGAAAIQCLQTLACSRRRVGRYARIAMHAERFFQQLARTRTAVQGIDRVDHHRDRRQLADCIGRGKESFAASLVSPR